MEENLTKENQNVNEGSKKNTNKKNFNKKKKLNRNFSKNKNNSNNQGNQNIQNQSNEPNVKKVQKKNVSILDKKVKKQVMKSKPVKKKKTLDETLEDQFFLKEDFSFKK